VGQWLAVADTYADYYADACTDCHANAHRYEPIPESYS
jgi:hypothetical protein